MLPTAGLVLAAGQPGLDFLSDKKYPPNEEINI
jgi:hypothetical protein